MSAPTFGSVFAGIGGFDLGFERAGFQCAWQVEINPFGRKVLAKHWPDVPKHDDVRTCGAHNLAPVDLIVGGFPCQDLSVAGKRAGLAGQRSGLYYELTRLVRELRPSWVVFENVPGLLSSHGGRDFYAVLSEMADCGLRRAYRILDSQYFGVAQRRQRVFLVGSARATGGDPAAVLFEPAGVRGDSAAGQEAGQGVAATLRGRAARPGVNVPGRGAMGQRGRGYDDFALSGGLAVAFTTNQRDEVRELSQRAALSAVRRGDAKQETLIAGTLNANSSGGRRTTDLDGHGAYVVTSAPDKADTLSVGANQTLGLLGGECVAHTLRAEGCDASEDGTGRGTPLVVSGLTAKWAKGSGGPAGDEHYNLIAPTLDRCEAEKWGSNQWVNAHSDRRATTGVRRLTPTECERLQGFPDGHTCLCGVTPYTTARCICPDTPRYAALGNAVTVNVIEWIAHRLMAEWRRTQESAA